MMEIKPDKRQPPLMEAYFGGDSFGKRAACVAACVFECVCELSICKYM